MLTQIRKFGAHTVLMADKAHRWPFLAAGAEQHGWYVTSPCSAPVVGSSPLGLEGYKTIAYEIVLDLGRAPDWVALPVCYGDALAGIHQGFKDLTEAGLIASPPRFLAAEAHGSLSYALRDSKDVVDAATPSHQPLAASVAAVQSTYQALVALRESRGLAVQVGNDGLVEMQERVASQAGLFLELASVMPFVAVQAMRAKGVIARGETVVCLATASGLKDTDRSTHAFAELPIATGSVDETLVRTAAMLAGAQG
jgi:threonine synthase